MKVNPSPLSVFSSRLHRLGVVLFSFLSIILGRDAGATLIAYDPMNYSGSQLNTTTAAPSGAPNQATGTGGGFTGNWSGGALTLNSFGVAYANLPVAGKSISSLGANNLYTHIASAPTTGSVWVSFLFKQTGDNGGNRAGVILENSSGVGVMLSYQQFGAMQGKPCLMAMSSPTAVGSQIGTSANVQTYANTNLYVLQFVYTGGVVSSISVYSNPTAGQTTVPTPDFTVTSGLPSFGALVNFGLYDGSAMGITLDEFRVGTTYGDVVGVSLIPLNVSVTSPTNNQSVSVYNFNVSANAGVVPGSVTNVAFYLDNTLITNLTAAPYTYTQSGVAAGAHSIYAVATDDSANNATSATINFTAADLFPSVTLTNPAATSQFLVGSNITLGARASDDGSVANVGFYVDGNSVGNASASPYSANWMVTPGAHALTAVATDGAGQSTTSAVVNVTGTLPTVAITSPTNSQAVSIYNFNVTASASVTPGTITNVGFYFDGSLFTNKTGSPYTVTYSGAATGSHDLQAVATDNNGNSVTSSVVSVIAADLPPSVTLTNPANGGQFLSGSTVTLGASASDDNLVTNVDFYVDGTLTGSSVASPFVTAWIATPGAHVLTAVAMDDMGQSTTSAVVNVTGTLPTVSISTPTNNQSVSTYSFNVTANASVTPGAITNVTLYLDSAPLGSKTASPYTFTLTSTALGAHTLDAVAMDINGNAVTSAVVNVTAADLAPTVTLTNPAAGSALVIGSSVSLGATATDDNSVTNVEFYVDGVLKGSSSVSPYNAAWNVTSLGTHALTAVAYDNLGQSSTSAVVNVSGVLNFNAYEPFNYTLGAFTNGTVSTGTGFKGNWVCSAPGTIVAGLTYANLPVSNQALQNNAGYQIERLAGVTSNATLWVSVLFQQGGDNGGNRSGFLMEDANGKGLMFAYTQATGTQGFPSLVNISGTNTVGTTISTRSSTLRTYNTANLYVFKLTYTAGVLTSVAVYSNPTAGQSTAPTADFTVSGLTGIGLVNTFGVNSPSGQLITIDEIRTGSTFGSVVGVPLPSAPLGLTATPGNGQVALNWTAPTNGSPTGYNIKRSTVSGLEVNIDTVAGTTYTDSTVNNGTTYYYEVSGTNAAGEGFYSNEAMATPAAAPGQVQDLVAVAGVNSVALNWTATSGASGYLVLRGTTSGTYTVTNAVSSNTNFDATAAGGTTFYYAVQATNAGGVGPISTEVSATPGIAGPDAPDHVNATPGNSQVALNWPIALGATAYNVKRSAVSGAETLIAVVTGTNYLDTTAINGNVCYYTVSSTNSAGESADSPETMAAMPPASPTDLNATPGANQVTLNWTASAGASGATSYRIARSTTSGSGYTTIGTVTSPTVSYTDTTAISGTTYYYVVAGVNASGAGVNSSEASATPSGVPQAPTGVTVTTNYTSLTLKWTAAQGAPTSYNVKRSTTSGTEVTLPAGTGVTGTTFTDTATTVGTTYFYTVAAVNGSGEGADSAEVSGTAPGAPLAYEPFNYSELTNGSATTATGFSGSWSITNGAAVVSGLSYPNLYTSNSALQVTSGNQYENLSVPLFSGSIYVSFLYSQSGDFGGNRGGFQLLNRNGNGLTFAYHQFGSSAGLPSIDAVTGYNSVGSELGVSTVPQTYTTPNLYVIRLDYSSVGELTNVAFYSNPQSGQSLPAPDFTISSGLAGIGAITTLGMRTGLSTTVDEWRVGTTVDQVVVGKPFATVTLNNLNQTYDGTAKSVTATTVPAGLTVALTYDGSANAPTNAGSYQVVGQVVDANYYGSATNTLVIVNSINTGSTNIVTSVSGNQMTLSWPADHTGWTVQAQTNGFTGTWYDLPGSSATNSITITVDPANPSVFFRMKY